MTGRWRVATIVTRMEGGAGAQVLAGARSLSQDTFEVTLVTGGGGRLLRAAAEAGLETVVEPALQAPIAPLRDRLAWQQLTSLLRERTFDVVHTHCAKAGAIGRVSAHRAGVPRIVHTYHGFPFHEFQSATRRRAYVAIERRLGRITDVTLCVGAGVAVEAIRRGLAAPGRVRTIGVAVPGADTGVSVGRTAREIRRARLALGLPVEATVVGAVARLTYQKAPEDFLSTLKQLGRPGVIGVWVGGGELAARIGRLTRDLPPGVRVVLTGERTDVPAVLPAFDVFALPSRYEGLPTAVVEAMVCGVPVVATAVNAVSDVVLPGETGLLVPPGRPDLMAEAVRYLLDSPSAAVRMAAAARAHIGERYSERALGQALEAAYIPGSAGGPAGRVTKCWRLPLGASQAPGIPTSASAALP